jgi:hypothetical protein
LMDSLTVDMVYEGAQTLWQRTRGELSD